MGAATGRRMVIVAVPDLNGVLRGKALTGDEFERIRDDHIPLTDQVFAVDPLDVPIPGLHAGTTRGAPNVLLRPDVTTLRDLPWADGWSICLADAFRVSGEPLSLAPRSVLADLVGRAEDRDVRVLAAFEYEFRLTSGDGFAGRASGISYSTHELSAMTAFLDALVETCQDLQLDVGAVHTEGGRGLLEVSLDPRHGMRAADDAALFKWTVKEVANQHGLTSSFLAKAVADEEGSSGHLHVSCSRADGQPLLRRQDAGRYGLAPAAASAIEGTLRHMPAASLFCNPTINSYKRLVPGCFAPVNATWGFDNRTAAVRVLPAGDAGALRIENRRPGADANPYLVLAASLASLLLGLDRESEVPAPVTDDAGQRSDLPLLPASLDDALRAFAEDDQLRGALGKEFSTHYEATRRVELAAWQATVTDWERQRYREIT